MDKLIAWQTRGLADEVGYRFERPLRIDAHWLLQWEHLRMQDEWLVYDWHEYENVDQENLLPPIELMVTSDVAKGVPITKGMLLDFTALAKEDVKDDAFLRYARRWGVLNLCTAGLPRTSWCRCSLKNGTNCWLASDSIVHADGASFGEPLYLWRWYARAAWTILNVASSLRNQEESPAPEDFYFLWCWLGIHIGLKVDSVERCDNIIQNAVKCPDEIAQIARAMSPLAADYRAMNLAEKRVRAQAALDETMNRWLAELGITLHHQWSPKPRLSLECSSVLGGIGMLLVEALNGSRMPARCEACKTFFTPKGRNRSANKRAFCDDRECRRARDRIHQQESRARKRLAAQERTPLQ